MDKLKKKIIQDYRKLLRRVAKGHIDKYDLILNEISFVELCNQLENNKSLKEYFLNNEL